MEHYTRSISAKQCTTYFFFSSSILPSLPSRSLSMSSTWSKQEMTHPFHVVRVPLQVLSTFRHYCLALEKLPVDAGPDGHRHRQSRPVSAPSTRPFESVVGTFHV